MLAAEQLQDCVSERSVATVQATPTARRQKIRHVIEGLMESGVRPAAIPPWLLVIMSLVELLPDVIAIIQRIIEAINGGKQPVELLSAIRQS